MIKLPLKTNLLSRRRISDFYPFLALIILSIILVSLALLVKNVFAQNILANMTATSLYALLALFTYDTVKQFSDREKSRELREYAESEVDPHIMSILIMLSKLIYTKKEKPRASNKIKELAELPKTTIKLKLTRKKYLGFEVFRNSTETTKNIRSLLENSFIRPLLDDDLVLLLLKLTNRLERLFKYLSQPDNLIKLNETAKKEYVIFGSKEISSYNAYFPNRKLLVKKIPGKKGMGVVEDFADFAPNIEIDKLLNYYKVKENRTETVSGIILEILKLLKSWISKR